MKILRPCATPECPNQFYVSSEGSGRKQNRCSDCKKRIDNLNRWKYQKSDKGVAVRKRYYNNNRKFRVLEPDKYVEKQLKDLELIEQGRSLYSVRDEGEI